MATKKVNIDIIARDKSQQALNKVRGNLDGVKKAVFNVRNALAGLGAGLAVRSLVKTGMEIESLQVRLKFLFGSAEEGAKAFDNMAKFAAKVPFSLEQIQQGAGVLSVVSKDADELSDILEITGNVAAVTGLDFRTASEQIQRSLSAGIASADLFREKGVRDLLGFKAGATVTAEETAEAFERVFGKGGKFGGATDELAKTLEGTLSMIGDKFFNFKKTILEAGFFPELKKQFGDLDVFLEENGETIDEIATKIGKGLAQATKTTADAVKFLSDNFETLKGILATIIALKVAAFFHGMATAIGIADVALISFNRRLLTTNTRMAVIGTAISLLNGDFGLMAKLEKDAAEAKKKDSIESTKLTSHMKVQNEIMKESNLLLENNNEHMRVKQRLTAEQAGLFDLDKILEGLKKEEEELIKTMQVYAEYGMQRRRMLKSIAEEEEETLKRTAMQNEIHANTRIASDKAHFQKQLDMHKEYAESRIAGEKALEDQKAKIQKQAKDHTISESRDALEILAGMNRTAFQAFKAVRIAEAIVDTHTAAVAAFRNFGGFPFGAIAAAATVAKGMAMVAQIRSTSFRQGGGSVNKNQAYMVGETGPEMFVPSGSGKIVPNNKVGNSQPVNVNFNINTVDARGFNELLVNSRGVIVNLINSAVNEKGRAAII